MNLPNMITMSRLVITVACFVCVELGAGAADRSSWMWWAFAAFLFAAVTDFVDGMLARRLGQVTRFGRIADPFADKLLVCGAMIQLLQFADARSILPAWVVVVIVGREFLVTSVRGLLESSGHPFPADRLGKWKMVVQCVAVSGLLTVLAGSDVFHGTAVVAVWLSLAMTVVSGLNYVLRARRLLVA